MSEDQVTHAPTPWRMEFNEKSAVASIEGPRGDGNVRSSDGLGCLCRIDCATRETADVVMFPDVDREQFANAKFIVLAVNSHDALTARVAELEAENIRLRRDAAILLDYLDLMSEASGDEPEGEDAAMIEQIRADIERPSTALTKPEACPCATSAP